ncbi:hypothetical protein [Glaciecola sp. MF2-115]|uniref:hypothetical protein n=1 Tax=Glaciecola sp. MF2-115 TaxID=3384827 RepID=UPI00399F0836
MGKLGIKIIIAISTILSAQGHSSINSIILFDGQFNNSGRTVDSSVEWDVNDTFSGYLTLDSSFVLEAPEPFEQQFSLGNLGATIYSDELGKTVGGGSFVEFYYDANGDKIKNVFDGPTDSTHLITRFNSSSEAAFPTFEFDFTELSNESIEFSMSNALGGYSESSITDVVSYNLDDIQQSVFIDWSSVNPVGFVQTQTSDGWDTIADYSVVGSNTKYQSVTQASRRSILAETRAIFERSGLNNIAIFDDVRLFDIFNTDNNVTTVNFHDELNFDKSLYGIAYEGVDFKNQTKNDNVTVFWNESYDLPNNVDFINNEQYYNFAHTIAHEVGHAMGAAHIDAPGLNNTMERFFFEPVTFYDGVADIDDEGNFLTHNPRWHLGRYGNGESKQELSVKNIEAGTYDRLPAFISRLDFTLENIDLQDAKVGYFLGEGESRSFIDVTKGVGLFQGSVYTPPHVLELIVIGKSDRSLTNYDVASDIFNVGNGLNEQFQLALSQYDSSTGSIDSFGTIRARVSQVSAPPIVILSSLCLFGILLWRKWLENFSYIE